jgi:protein-export membrane protein SecD
MKKNIVLNTVLILGSIALGVYFLIPSIIYYAKSPEERITYLRDNPKVGQKIINLGLDLQGGMRLVLEIDRSKLEKADDKDVLDRAYTIIENRINALGVSEPSIQKQGKERLIIELPGLKDEETAKNVIGKTAQLEFNLLREPAQLERAISVIDNVVAGKLEKSPEAGKQDSTTAKEKEQQELGEKLFKGSDTDSAKTDTTDTSKGQENPFATSKSFKDYLVQISDQVGVRVEDIGKVKELLARTDVRQAIDRAGLGANSFLWSHDTTQVQGQVFKTLYYVKSSPEMRGDMISDARASIDQGGVNMGKAKVDIEMNNKGAKRFSSVTAANVNKFLAIVLDSSVYSAPRIIQKIPLGKAEITGNFSMPEARDLAIVLRAGALPAPVKIIEERTVGPSLGQDSIDQALYAGLLGCIFVIVFTLIYYRLSGGIALVALAINILAVLAMMAMFNATLTLPGIAGLILQVAMGIDSNVIIFERIREELRIGKKVRSGIDLGYKMATWTILDSHLTALITGVIIYWKGTGALRGFAITLIFGLLTNIFTSLYVTRVFQNIVFEKHKEKMSI